MYKCFLCDYEGNMEIKSSVEGRDIVKCPKCELEFIYNQPSFEEIKNIYSSDYYKAWGMESGENTEVASMKKSTFADMLKKFCPTKNAETYSILGRLLVFCSKRLKNWVSSLTESNFPSIRVLLQRKNLETKEYLTELWKTLLLKKIFLI